MKFGDNIQHTVLPSGLTVITDRIPGVDVLAAELVVHAGSLHDPVDKNGLAHFAEHLMGHAVPGMSDADLTKNGGKLVLRGIILQPGRSARVTMPPDLSPM